MQGQAARAVTAPPDAPRRLHAVLYTLPGVVVLWLVIFAWGPLNFWLLMGAAQVILLGTALTIRPELRRMLRPSASDVAIGVGSALLLYGVFLAGHEVSTRILPFAGDQIGDIYTIRSQAAAAVIGLLLLFVIGPGEEIYWRGLVQRTFVERWGDAAGMAVAVAVYAGVHVVAANVMLLGAAAVGGLFWGLLYWWRRSLPANIISHAVWDLTIMVLFPIT